MIKYSLNVKDNYQSKYPSLPKKGTLPRAPSQSIHSTEANHHSELYHHRLSGNLDLNPSAANL